MHTTYRINEENIPHVAKRIGVNEIALRRMYFVALVQHKKRKVYPEHGITLVFDKPREDHHV